MKNKKQLILKRIEELYKDYLREYNNPCATRYECNDLDIIKYALEVLVDIYTFDDKKNEEHRYIYHDWDLNEFIINELLNGDLK